MKVGDLVRFKHFKEEMGIVIAVHKLNMEPETVAIDVQRMDGALLKFREPDAFELVNENR
jgi:hypothetical protein